jgi:hypothetical protein
MKYLLFILALLLGCSNPNNLSDDNMLTCTTEEGHMVFSGHVEDVLLIGNAIAFTPLEGAQKGTRVTAVNMSCVSGTKN